MEFRIKHTWDGLPVSHEPITVGLRLDNAGLLVEVRAPFFNDPPAPPGEPGKPFGGLWDYEVVEEFFLSDRTEQYLEVELCPHGQYLLLLLAGRRKVWKEELPLEFEEKRGNMKHFTLCLHMNCRKDRNQIYFHEACFNVALGSDLVMLLKLDYFQWPKWNSLL
uniref:Chromosome 4 open reading frame 33 n=1 Tax=Cyanoderma ruficeps TaxID=181631 RepID=A0A8C3NND0_9PASS